jgi:hypothetical protein
MTRAVEEASWPTAIDNRFYRVCFDWLPASSFIAASAGFIPLIQVGDSVANQSISVFAFAADTVDREYYRSGVVGPSNPRIVLALNDGEAAQQTISLPVFWGGYVKDAVIGRFESPIQIEVWHHARYGVGLIVRNGWAEGHVHILRGIDPSSWSATGDITIYGGGWWSEPETKKLDAAWKNTYVEQENETGALLAGDRDPTFGQVSARGCFRYTETFTRVDDPNLGSYWDVILQTGNGFNIASNQARCEELGWERWDAYPYVRDCSVFADVSAPDGCKVGLFTRLNWGMGTKLFAHGYAGYLECTGASTANLVIVSKFWNAGVQDEAVLATQAISYTESSTVTLELEAVGSTITLRVGAQTVSTTDATHARPGAFGILGETTGAGVYVYVDSVWAELRGDQLLRITE